ncbi:uncharacterized protein LOC127264158 [Andrographis paniculata]|uniref:uncharacterized protein LOC127264158 n=1 Tax=Andrographis paniculata TaxID=175694 RepID=UPI0021E78C5D|nr:uncharacterized protein LOC127264158 [Andrographis paniculata]XP_051149551.1 uncharacterized protein LOC127264158 [Andrographis paniculata]XP_051149559.1 uncharacterized protein LOC127264158 [Andrographis paniculata]
MKESERRGSTPNSKGKSHSSRPGRKQQKKSGAKNLKARETDARPSEKSNSNTSLCDLKNGVEPLEALENVVLDHVDALANSSSGIELDNETDTKISNNSVACQGNIQADEEKMESVSMGFKRIAENTSSDGYSDTPRSKPDRKENKPEINASRNTPKNGAKPVKGISNSIHGSSSDNLKNMKVHPKPLSDSLEGPEDRSLELDSGVDTLKAASNGANGVNSQDEAVSTHEYDKSIDQAAVDEKVEELENRIKVLESELREVAALEIALYSVVPDHSCTSHKVHTPARRLSRLYIYACKYWTQDKRASVARNTVSGLVLVSKSCGNDVSRLSFWLSNTVVLREVISLAFGISSQSSTIEKAFESNGDEMKTSLKWKDSNGSRQLNKQGLLMFAEDWQETRTFTTALEKIESWIFSRIVESIWWQTLAPNMQSHIGGSTKNQDSELNHQNQVVFSIRLWENAFQDALKRLCPVRAQGHDCGCLPALARKVMEQCISRLDVAMFNAILRESVHEIPTDPVSDPIVNSKVLPIPAGDLSFGSGAQLKNSVGNWTRWLSEYFGMDVHNENNIQDGEDKRDTKEPPKRFPLLNALSDLLMLPKDMLMDSAIRMEVCPTISLPLVRRVLCNFSPDEFCPDSVPGAVLEAINAECLASNSSSSFPYSAAPIVYTAPSSLDNSEEVGEGEAVRFESSEASDEEVESCLGGIILHRLPSSPPTTVARSGKPPLDEY